MAQRALSANILISRPGVFTHEAVMAITACSVRIRVGVSVIAGDAPGAAGPFETH